jgi:hypothetical protein
MAALVLTTAHKKLPRGGFLTRGIWYITKMMPSLEDRPKVQTEARNVLKWLAALASVIVVLIAAGCDQRDDSNQTSAPIQTAATAKNAAQIKMEPGCPLGAVALSGISEIENVCKPTASMVPRGPIGTPMP